MMNEDLAAMTREGLVAELLGCASPPALHDGGADEGRQQPLLARKLAVAREILQRDLLQQMSGREVLSSPDVVRAWLVMRLAHLENEVFLVLFLDTHNRLIVAEELFRGTLTQTSVYPREVIKRALLHNAASLVLAHCHPSLKADVSHADRLLTVSLKAALACIDVHVLDHFVVGGTEVVSFAERGWL